MNNWIPFAEGEYLAEQAFLLGADQTAVGLENTVITVRQDKSGKRHLQGRSRVRNILIVELLENNDDLDLVLDMGREFKYYLKRPELRAGKVFSPDVKSLLQFTPSSPWEKMRPDEFEKLLTGLRFLPD
jgi:hypothetical protein